MLIYVHSQYCPHCGAEQISDEIATARDIDFWQAHCEAIFKSGYKPRSYSKLPDYLKTEEMKEYYQKLSKRIKARQAWLKKNQEVQT